MPTQPTPSVPHWPHGATSIRILSGSPKLAIRVLVAVAVFTVAIQPAAAINIVIQLGNEGENPQYDASGNRLRDIFNAAAAYWEDYLPAGGTYEVDVFWSTSEFEDDPALARWSFQFGGDNNIRVNPNPGGDGWFIDPTPFDHSEYNFDALDRTWSSANNRWAYRGGNWLYEDIASNEQSGWFNGSPHDLLEVGYRGRAPEGPLRTQFDLLSTVIHELGHELGVNSTGGPWTANPAFLPSGSVVMEENAAGGHLAARTSLMCGGCGMQGTRRMPSAIDIMAVADDEGFGVIDLPRQDYVGNGSWHNGSRWFGGSPPDSGDLARVREAANVTLTANARVEELFLSTNGRVNTQNRKLTVDSDTTVEAFLFDGPNTEITIPAGGELETRSLNIKQGKVTLAGGKIDVGSGPLTIGGFPGLLRGHGTIELSGPLNNLGEIRGEDGTLTVQAFIFDGGTVNLDGTSEQGFVNLTNGDLVINGTAGLTDAFDGTMTLGPGHSITVQAAWTLGSGGELDFHSQGFLGSAVKGGTFVVRGNIDTHGLGAIESPAIFESTADVDVIGNDSGLLLMGGTTFRGGSYTGGGLLMQWSNATVESDTQIDVGTYDMDGSESTPATITIPSGSDFIVNSRRLETSQDGFDGMVNITGGTLDVRTHNTLIVNNQPFDIPVDWRMEGTLNLSDSGGPGRVVPARVAGSRMIVGNASSPQGARINVGGYAQVTAPVTFESTANVNISNNATLSLESSAATIYRGGSYTGLGQLQQSSDATVEGNTTIQVATYDMDGANEDAKITINEHRRFSVDTLNTDDVGNAFDGEIVINRGGMLDMRPHFIIGFNGTLTRVEESWRMQGDLGMLGVGSPSFVTGNKMFVGQPDTSEPVARIRVGKGNQVIRNDGVEFEDRSALQVELGGTTAGQYSWLSTTSDVILDGTLDINLVDGFVPAVGDTFRILSTLGTVSGAFHSISGGPMWGVTYNPSDVILELLVDFLSADFDMDGDVDGQDYLIWQGGFPMSSGATSADGDADGDGDVDGEDFLLWQGQFGVGSGNGQGAAIPEPTTALLLFAVLLPLSRARTARDRT